MSAGDCGGVLGASSQPLHEPLEDGAYTEEEMRASDGLDKHNGFLPVPSL
jgi:hypothetical protein